MKEDETVYDPEQIAQDHINVILEDYESGVLDSYLSDIELSSENANLPSEKKFYE